MLHKYPAFANADVCLHGAYMLTCLQGAYIALAQLWVATSGVSICVRLDVSE